MIPSETPRPHGPEYLRSRAGEYRAMAETATNHETAEGLLRLAERFDELARAMERGNSC
jgi:hypothetical protein